MKNSKSYQESPFLSESRLLYEFLNNEYMVCSGYVWLLFTLCYELGIPCVSHSVVCGDPKEAIPGSNHARLYVFLEDPKYGISGYYVSDPTFDRSISNENDFLIEHFSRLVMTTSEARSSVADHRDSFLTLSDEELFHLLELQDHGLFRMLLFF